MPDPLRRRNHFVPASYLAGFTNSRSRVGTLAVYERTVGAPVRLLRPQDVATKRDLYVRDLGHGQLDDQVERLLADHVDGPFAPIRDRLAFGAEVGMLPSISAVSPADREVLARFAAFQMLRTPEEREATRWLGEFSSHALMSEKLGRNGEVRRYFEQLRGSIFTDREVESLRTTLLNLSPLRRQTQDWLPRTVRIAIRLAEALLDMKWRLIRASHGLEFVTSDMPFVCVRRGASSRERTLGAAIGESGFEATLALSPGVVLYMSPTDPGDDYFASTDLTASLRERTVRYARRWVYARQADESIQRLLQESPTPYYYAVAGNRVFTMRDSPEHAYREMWRLSGHLNESTLVFRYGVP
jgi:hypothetical protein